MQQYFHILLLKLNILFSIFGEFFYSLKIKHDCPLKNKYTKYSVFAIKWHCEWKQFCDNEVILENNSSNIAETLKHNLWPVSPQ